MNDMPSPVMEDPESDWQSRTRRLIGAAKCEMLSHAHVLAVGLGGVGAYAAEQLCRAGIGEMTLVDADTIALTNLNRQLPALHSTLGKSKAEVMAERFRDINPDIKIHVIQEFIQGGRIPELLKSARFDYVVDAIDSVVPKVGLLYHAVNMRLPAVSSMGAGRKTDPTKIRLADISQTTCCPLAKAVRRLLAKAGIRHGVQCVYSIEEASPAFACAPADDASSHAVGTISYMPAVFGCMAAAAVINGLIQ